ncbi:MAG TPA: hypothetical protein VGQ55_05115 [Pyrinomonadaceae bacterium]|nr:hypothetical protein [Pyrinomonadaceae bacterium]
MDKEIETGTQVRTGSRSDRIPPLRDQDQNAERIRQWMTYVAVPLIFLTAALLGGLRLSPDSSFIFLRPALICLIFASILVFLYARSGLIDLKGWINEEFTLTQNATNAIVLITLFVASTQLFNSLLPEQGIPFWVVGFCFFWTLWNDLFADFDAKKLLRSLGGLFGLAFALKYLLLANLTASEDAGWLKGLLENPGQEVMTRLLELPRYSSGTGYIQFFTAVLYLLGLYLLPQTIGPKPSMLPARKLDDDPLPAADERDRIEEDATWE